jgi:hypothetical protein
VDTPPPFDENDEPKNGDIGTWVTMVDASVNGINMTLNHTTGRSAGQALWNDDGAGIPGAIVLGSSPPEVPLDEEEALWKQVDTPSPSLMPTADALSSHPGTSLILNPRRVLKDNDEFGDIWATARQAELMRLREDYSEDQLQWVIGTGYDNGDRFIEDAELSPASCEDIVEDGDSQVGHSLPSIEDSESGNTVEGSQALEVYNLVDVSCETPEPRPGDECILCSVVMFTPSDAELYLMFVDHKNCLYFKICPLPPHHPARPENKIAYNLAMNEALREHAEDRKVNPLVLGVQYSWQLREGDPVNEV